MLPNPYSDAASMKDFRKDTVMAVCLRIYFCIRKKLYDFVEDFAIIQTGKVQCN
jgi:hypothetical protein